MGRERELQTAWAENKTRSLQLTEVARTITRQVYKGMCNQGTNVVIEELEDEICST